MGEIILEVTPSALRNQSKAVRETVGKIEKDFDKIRKIVENTSYWEGLASDKHKEIFSANEEDIQLILKRLSEHPVDLEKMAGVYEATEEFNEELANALLTDVIS